VVLYDKPLLMSKLKYPIFIPPLPERISERYKGNILTYLFINENSWEVGIFGCCAALEDGIILKELSKLAYFASFDNF